MGIDNKAKSSSVQTLITFYGIPRQYLLFILCLFPVIHHDASPSIRNTQVVDKKITKDEAKQQDAGDPGTAQQGNAQFGSFWVALFQEFQARGSKPC